MRYGDSPSFLSASLTHRMTFLATIPGMPRGSPRYSRTAIFASSIEIYQVFVGLNRGCWVKKKPKHPRKQPLLGQMETEKLKPLILGHVGSCWVMLTRTVKPLKAGLGHFGSGTSRNFLRNDRCTSQLDFFMKYTPTKYAFMVLTTIINHYITIINHH